MTKSTRLLKLLLPADCGTGRRCGLRLDGDRGTQRNDKPTRETLQNCFPQHSLHSDAQTIFATSMMTKLQ
jgi:hypothetical protein